MDIVGRLAPSPTGYLHLGNAWSFLWTWLSCRQQNGKLILRIEDIDPIRSTQAFAHEIERDLHWLGLEWDGLPIFQSTRSQLYDNALKKLDKLGRIYPCYCTRKELRDIAGAPHVGDCGAPYPGTCRHLTLEQRSQKELMGRHPCIRLNTEGLHTYQFNDGICGPQSKTVEECGGDFALRRSDGVWSYQLAVSVDDGTLGVNQVVRGQDILPSTPRQIALLELLGYKIPSYAHIPLLCDSQGNRLAKRHESLSLRSLRDSGYSAEQIIGILAYTAGFISKPCPTSLHDLLSIFDIRKLPCHPVTLDIAKL